VKQQTCGQIYEKLNITIALCTLRINIMILTCNCLT